MDVTDSSQGRLKPVKSDLLESVGLPSKGDVTLNSFARQKEFFDCLKRRCEAKGLGPSEDSSHGDDQLGVERLDEQFNNLTFQPAANEEQIHIIRSAMRKLRESLMATNRRDELTREAYLYIIRSSIRQQYHEAYHPALLYLLRTPGLAKLLGIVEYLEIVRYAVLDLAGRQDALREAWELAWRTGIFKYQRNFHETQRSRNELLSKSLEKRNETVRRVLHAATRNDVMLFHIHKQELSENEGQLVGPLQRRLDLHTVRCLSKAYFEASIYFVEHVINLRWYNEVEKDCRGLREATKSWQIEDTRLIFRKPHARKGQGDPARPALPNGGATDTKHPNA